MLLDYSSLLLGGVVCAKQYLLSQVGMSGGDVGDTASSSSASFSSGASALLARDGSDRQSKLDGAGFWKRNGSLPLGGHWCPTYRSVARGAWQKERARLSPGRPPSSPGNGPGSTPPHTPSTSGTNSATLPPPADDTQPYLRSARRSALVCAWKPARIGVTLRDDPQFWQCRKYNRDVGSRVSDVCGDRHIWQVTYSTIYFLSKLSMYFGMYLPLIINL